MLSKTHNPYPPLVGGRGYDEFCIACFLKTHNPYPPPLVGGRGYDLYRLRESRRSRLAGVSCIFFEKGHRLAGFFVRNTL